MCTHQLPSSKSYYWPGELHSAIMVCQKRHAENGILADLTYHKDFFQLHVSYLYWYLHDAIKGELDTISHLTVRVAHHALVLKMSW